MASPGADPLNPATDPGSSHTGSGMEAAKENAEQLKERVKDRAADLKRKAEDTVQDMGARARSAADEQKNVAAERVGGVAHALRVASDDLRERGQPMVAEYSRQVAEGLESMAQSLSRRSVDDLVEGTLRALGKAQWIIGVRRHHAIEYQRPDSRWITVGEDLRGACPIRAA